MSGWHMPAESVPQDRVWMAFPVRGYSLGDTPVARDEARSTWAAVAHAIVEFEPARCGRLGIQRLGEAQ